ncbi:hypothetical protein BH23PLA1_BH23PLA1_23830 [soil metagenome]
MVKLEKNLAPASGCHIPRQSLWENQRRPSHLKRDFQKCVNRGGADEPIGQAGLKVVGALFALWEEFGAGRIDRASLQQGLEGHELRR